MSLLLDNRIGAEDLQLAIYSQLFQRINDYVAAEETRGQTVVDAALTALNGRVQVPVTLELFDSGSIHFGHRPSMIEAPVERYPSMSVMTYNATPAASNATADYGHSLGLRTAIEAIVKSDGYGIDDEAGIGEDIVNRRIKRTGEAIHKLMQDYQAPGGLFFPPETPPTIIWGDIFARDSGEDENNQRRYYWQGVRMEYIYLKQTVFGIDQ